MKILYFPCHSTLQNDEVTLLKELGHEVIIGTTTQQPIDFDICIAVFRTHWLYNNYKWLKGHRVYYRTIGQSHTQLEETLKQYVDRGLNIIRYSPREQAIPKYAGHLDIIRFYKDENIFKGWTGQNTRIVGFNKKMKKRAHHCNFDWFLTIMNQFIYRNGLSHGFSIPILYGKDNEDIYEIDTAVIENDKIVSTLQQERCMLYTGTFPASYTLAFIEALMIGLPIVAADTIIFNQYFSASNIFGNIYEIPDILNGTNGFCVKNISQAQYIIEKLLYDYNYAKSISREARKTAINLFGKTKIKNQWKQVLDQGSILK